MASQNIFLDEWRSCLYAHYVHIVHEGDALNEHSLRQVLLSVGFTESELERIRTEPGAEQEIELSPHSEYSTSADDDQSSAEDQAPQIAIQDAPIPELALESAVDPAIEIVEPELTTLAENEPLIEEEPETGDENGEEPDNPVQMSLF